MMPSVHVGVYRKEMRRSAGLLCGGIKSAILSDPLINCLPVVTTANTLQLVAERQILLANVFYFIFFILLDPKMKDLVCVETGRVLHKEPK